MCFSITEIIGFNTMKDKICAHNIYVESNKKVFFLLLSTYMLFSFWRYLIISSP